MPSNEELIKTVGELSAALEIEPPLTEGLNNNELATLVKDLRAKKTDSENKTAADAAMVAREDAAKARAEAVRKLPEFYVKPGRSLTTKRGILSGDRRDEITAADLPGGKPALEAFITKGFIGRG